MEGENYFFRDHVFDMEARSRYSKKRKLNEIKDFDVPGHRPKPIRSFHKESDSLVLAHKRAGLSDSVLNS